MIYRTLLPKTRIHIFLHLRPFPKYKSLNCHFRTLSTHINKPYPCLFCPKGLQATSKFLSSLSHTQSFKNPNDTHVKTTTTDFSKSNAFPVIPFPESENESFHQILRENRSYQHLLMPQPPPDYFLGTYYDLKIQDVPEFLEKFLSGFGEYSRPEILTRLNKLAKLPTDTHPRLMKDEKFSQLCKLLTSQLSRWDDQEFFSLLQVLIRFDFRLCVTPTLRPLRLRVSSAFDEECMRRIAHFSTEQLFMVCDFFFYLRYNKSSKFCRTFFSSIQDVPLSDPELILALFYANLSRNVPQQFVDKALESVSSISNDLSLEEMAIVCLGFFKTKYQIRNIKFLERLVDKLHRGIHLVDPITVSALFKGLHISTSKTFDKALPTLFPSLSKVLDSVAKELHAYPLATFMHVFLYFHFIHFINSEFAARARERLVREDVSCWRIKDVAKICYSVANLGSLIPPMPEFWDKVLQDLESSERQMEVKRYPQYLLSTLISLSYVGLYPEKLIDRIFQPTTLEDFNSMRNNSRLDFRRDLFQLNESVRLECQDYNGCLLPQDFLRSLSRNHEVFGKMPDIMSLTKGISQRDRFFLNLVNSLNKLFKNEKKYSIDFLLPHFQTADIEIRTDVEGEAVFQKLWKAEPTKTVITSSSDCHLTDLLLHLSNGNSFQRIAVVLFGPNSYCRVYNQETEELSFHLLGLHRTKVRQLKKKGFKVVQIPYFEFSSSSDQINYIQQKIFHQQNK